MLSLLSRRWTKGHERMQRLCSFHPPVPSLCPSVLPDLGKDCSLQFLVCGEGRRPVKAQIPIHDLSTSSWFHHSNPCLSPATVFSPLQEDSLPSGSSSAVQHSCADLQERSSNNRKRIQENTVKKQKSFKLMLMQYKITG